MAYDILWRVHGILMASSLLAMTAGIIMKKTYRIHRKLGLYAAGSGLTALIIAVLMVQLSVGGHLTSTHSFLGIFTILLLMSTPLLMLLKKTRTKKPLRLLHRFLGLMTFLLMLTTLVSGLFFVGILA